MPKTRPKYYKSSALPTFRSGGRAGGFWDKLTETTGEVLGVPADLIGLGDEVRHSFGTMVGADQTSGAISDASSFIGGVGQGVVGTAANMVGAGGLYNKAITPNTVGAKTDNGDAFRNAGQITGKVASTAAGAAIGYSALGGLQGALTGLQATQSTNPIQTAATILPNIQMPTKANGGEIGNPNYEAENNEFVIGGNPNIYGKGQLERFGTGLNKIKGASHKNGGVEMSGGEYVVSAKKNYRVPETFLNDIKHLM